MEPARSCRAIDIVKLRIQRARRKHFAPDLLRRRIGDAKAGGVRERQGNRRQQIHVECPWQLHAMNKEIVGANGEICGEQVFRAGAGLLAVGRRHARIRAEDGRSDSW